MMVGKKTIGSVIIFLLALVFSSQSVFSSVEVFSNFDTIVKINSDDTVEINKSLTLKNVHTIGIVPGQIEFKIEKGDAGENTIFIDNAKAVDQYGNQIKTTIKNRDDFSVIILDVYYPLLPNFEYAFDLTYTFSYDPSGIFFKSLQIPVRQSTIPIEEGDFQVILPDSYSFTFISEEGFDEFKEENLAKWQIEEDYPKAITFEYSYIPINTSFARGSYLFWILINIVLLGFLMFEIRKAVKRVKAEYEDEES